VNQISTGASAVFPMGEPLAFWKAEDSCDRHRRLSVQRVCAHMLSMHSHAFLKVLNLCMHLPSEGRVICTVGDCKCTCEPCL
jgi:hypothetical protein